MKIHFLGANRQVTGSRYCLETRESRVMIDCGMFQEREFQGRNWLPSVLPTGSIHAMVLTHAHIDHCGLIPRIYREGFAGPIHATRATCDLLEIMLEDAVRIQLEDLKYKQKRHERDKRKGPYPIEPLYEPNDVQRALQARQGHSYGQAITITPDITVTFHDAGHILGSAMLEFNVAENGTTRRVIFSGDIGQWDKPLLRDPSVFEQADYVVMESTYGDREHQQAGPIADQLEEALNTALRNKGNVVIPTFAVERAQELMYYISHLVHENRIPDVKIFLDSPMAIDVTTLFRQHRDEFDEATWQRLNAGQPPLHFPGLTMSRSTKESQAINDYNQPAIIMSTSGMCTAGRIKHHLRRNLPRPECVVLFVGYQAVGTLGRQILEGRNEVRIHGRNWPVRAQVRQIYGFSGHADQKGLLYWASQFREPPRATFLTHGEEQAALTLAQLLQSQHQWNCTIPHFLSAHDLT